MNPDQKLKLQEMISANNVEDNTYQIRKLKHSHVLRDNIRQLLKLKKEYNDEKEQIKGQIKEQKKEQKERDREMQIVYMASCPFLYNYYTDIYNKIVKDEIDLDVLFQALDVLQDIEDGNVDKHEGAYKFGMLLKTVYIDSALKKANKLDEQYASSSTDQATRGPQENITWTQFKKLSQATQIPKK